MLSLWLVVSRVVLLDVVCGVGVVVYIDIVCVGSCVVIVGGTGICVGVGWCWFDDIACSYRGNVADDVGSVCIVVGVVVAAGWVVMRSVVGICGIHVDICVAVVAGGIIRDVWRGIGMTVYDCIAVVWWSCQSCCLL